VLNKEGNLVSVSGGNLVLGEGGPIHLGQVDHKEITITADGYILVDAAQVAKLRVVKVGNPQELKAVSGSFYRGNEDQLDLSDDENPQAVQGYVETSNVSVIDQMMDLIYLNQKYSLATKVVQSYDENLAASMKMGELNQ
jgi:flagellar basal-body rod protein FlgG